MLRVDGDARTLGWGSSIWRFWASSAGAERMMKVSQGKSWISRFHCSVVRRPPVWPALMLMAIKRPEGMVSMKVAVSGDTGIGGR